MEVEFEKFRPDDAGRLGAAILDLSDTGSPWMVLGFGEAWRAGAGVAASNTAEGIAENESS